VDAEFVNNRSLLARVGCEAGYLGLLEAGERCVFDKLRRANIIFEKVGGVVCQN